LKLLNPLFVGVVTNKDTMSLSAQKLSELVGDNTNKVRNVETPPRHYTSLPHPSHNVIKLRD
jgi:hypothetical protein